MHIEEIINGTLRSSFVLIIDTIEQRGDKLVNALLYNKANKPLSVHGLCFEHFPTHQETRLSDCPRSLTLHDLFSGSVGWLTGTHQENDICNFINSKVERGSKVNIWVDSLSSALISIDAKCLYNQIHRLLNWTDEHGVEVVQLVSTIHADVETEETVNLLSCLATTVIHVKPAPKKQSHPLYLLTHKKPNGKIFKESQLFNVGEKGKIQTYPIAVENNAIPQLSAPSSVNKPVHDSFSTFRHGLNPEEQQARDKLVLPFQKLSMGASTKGQGYIEYEPEEADQWDEDDEDPDEDLEV